MQKFVSRRKNVEAVQWDGTEERQSEIATWLGGLHESGGVQGFIWFTTPEGRAVAVRTDWIVKGEGGFFVLSDELFRAQYEPAKEGATC